MSEISTEAMPTSNVNELKRSREEEPEQESNKEMKISPEDEPVKKPKTMNENLCDLNLQTEVVPVDENDNDCVEIASVTHHLNFTRFMELKDEVAINCCSITVCQDFDDGDDDVDDAGSVFRFRFRDNNSLTMTLATSQNFFTYGDLIKEICEADRTLRIAYSKKPTTKTYHSHIRSRFFEGLTKVDGNDNLYMINWES